MKIFSRQATFLLSLPKYDHTQIPMHPEIVFFGRSNVGKSSIINAILNQKSLAKTSNTPGRTRAINFFNVDDKVLFVDVPGYGYAKAVHDNSFEDMIMSYINLSKKTLFSFILMDARHPMKQNDIDAMQFLNSHKMPYQVILTKMDKLTQPEQSVIIESYPDFIKVSAKNFDGINAVRQLIVDKLGLNE